MCTIHAALCTFVQEAVRGLVERQDWTSSGPSDDPVEKLVAMGFGNRDLNKQLLQKHDNELQVI